MRRRLSSHSLGEPSTFVCPYCQGSLWRIASEPTRFRWHTGHGYTLRSLQHAQDEGTDDALWSALRALQEREFLLRALAREVGEDEAARLVEEADEIAVHAETLRRLVEKVPPPAA